MIVKVEPVELLARRLARSRVAGEALDLARELERASADRRRAPPGRSGRRRSRSRCRCGSACAGRSRCVASSSVALSCGYFFSAATVALTMNGRNVSLTPRSRGARVGALAQRHQLGAVDLLDVGEVRRGVLRAAPCARRSSCARRGTGCARRRRRVRRQRAARRARRARCPARLAPPCAARTSSEVTRPSGPVAAPPSRMSTPSVARQLARGRRGEHAAAVARGDAVRVRRAPPRRARPAAGASAALPLGLAPPRRRPPSLPPARRRSRRPRSTISTLPDRADLAFGEHALRDAPGARRRDLDRRLVGHDLDHRLVLVDDVAFLDEPADDLALDDAFADVGQVELVDHHEPQPDLRGSTRVARIADRASGRYSCSSVYGNGVSKPVTRRIGASR